MMSADCLKGGVGVRRHERGPKIIMQQPTTVAMERGQGRGCTLRPPWQQGERAEQRGDRLREQRFRGQEGDKGRDEEGIGERLSTNGSCHNEGLLQRGAEVDGMDDEK